MITSAEYLRLERASQTKSEYCGGVMVAMSGASWEYTLIKGEVERLLRAQLGDARRTVTSSDLRVRVPERTKYYYPDAAVVCGRPKFEDVEQDTLLNPDLIVELLSDTTEQANRGEKLDCYGTPKSLTEYLFVAQDRPHVELYARAADSGWEQSEASGLGAEVTIPAHGCTLRLADVYCRVEFSIGLPT